MARHLLSVHWPAPHPWRGEISPVHADRKDLMRKTTGTKRVARVPRRSGLWGTLAAPMLPELMGGAENGSGARLAHGANSQIEQSLLKRGSLVGQASALLSPCRLPFCARGG